MRCELYFNAPAVGRKCATGLLTTNHETGNFMTQETEQLIERANTCESRIDENDFIDMETSATENAFLNAAIQVLQQCTDDKSIALATKWIENCEEWLNREEEQ